ncbi:MAG TPA: phosphatase PAP2 family protein [Tepidisphaeraceae bacterium]|jgi:acid phosphatase (class A)|nr:phosphatase PAP2 family protein [Tepidisphaeraceae bacterium]
MMFRRILPVIFLLAATSCASRPLATTTTKPADRYAAPPFLTPHAIDTLTLLPPPPSPTSAEHLQEIQLILKLQRDRTPAQIAQVRIDNDLSVFNFANILGPGFTPERCPKTARFFDIAEIDEGFFARVGKTHYKRPRPTAEPGVVPVMPQGGFSYPSGHSTRATFFSELLAYLFPEKRDALIRRGQEIGFGREIAGVHYPSDVLAGRILGHALAHAMLTSPSGRAALDQLRPELQKALATP